jgi:hypothetical protein
MAWRASGRSGDGLKALRVGRIWPDIRGYTWIKGIKPD